MNFIFFSFTYKLQEDMNDVNHFFKYYKIVLRFFKLIHADELRNLISFIVLLFFSYVPIIGTRP